MVRVVAVGCLLLLGACGQQIPPLNFFPPNVGISNAKLDAEVRSIIVAVGRPDEQKGDVDIVLIEGLGTTVSSGSGFIQQWKDALEDSLNKMVIFRDDATKKINISVKILKLDVPSFGTVFETETIARYEITDRSNGDIIFSSEVASKGSTPADHAFLGATRARESVNRSVQNNISLFLQQLETVEINRPMFPAPAGKPMSMDGALGTLLECLA